MADARWAGLLQPAMEPSKRFLLHRLIEAVTAGIKLPAVVSCTSRLRVDLLQH